jgi:hypothetical protein
VDMELHIPPWGNQNGGIQVPQLDFLPSCLTCVCLVKLFCLAHQSSDGLHQSGIVLDVAVVELGQTIEDLDIYRSLGPGHVLNGLNFLGVRELAVLGLYMLQNNTRGHHHKRLFRI